ncbi:unnamed protein product [Rotaria socialis]|uniref:Uncharacterized protein n=1 Tax=Rotaria socialis TaxID=392032 RepID=A0A818C2U2_9BILA|nr:unnamed protein product [Rotaria socialis]CAF4270202.1 unnamed protein product [Rotaria socialis]
MAPKTNRNKRQRDRKAEKERLYGELFAPYEPSHPYSLHFVHNATTCDELKMFIDNAQTTTNFVFDTESNYLTNFPSIIQVMFMKQIQENSLVLIIETAHLPVESSYEFLQLKQLFYLIFRRQSHIYTWGALIDELTPFLQFNLFHLPVSSYIHNTQQVFKLWFNDWLAFQSTLNDNDDQDNDDTLIINAPAFDPIIFLHPLAINNIKRSRNESWSIQDATAYILNQYLPKKCTLRQWSIGLDDRILNRTRTYSSTYRKKMISYAANDCTSLAAIITFMYQSHIPSALQCVQYPSDIGEYSFDQEQNGSSLSFQVHLEDITTSDDEDMDYPMAVHDINERHSMEISNAEPYHQQLHDDNVLTIINDSNLLNDNINIKQKIRQRRTVQAQKRRNQKTSIRHRKNRYIYEIIRPVNMSIKLVKNKLKEFGINYLNVNIVRSQLYIGLKSHQDQIEYENLLSMNSFV